MEEPGIQHLSWVCPARSRHWRDYTLYLVLEPLGLLLEQLELPYWTYWRVKRDWPVYLIWACFCNIVAPGCPARVVKSRNNSGSAQRRNDDYLMRSCSASAAQHVFFPVQQITGDRPALQTIIYRTRQGERGSPSCSHSLRKTNKSRVQSQNGADSALFQAAKCLLNKNAAMLPHVSIWLRYCLKHSCIKNTWQK